ncbi:permuted papain-like amidase YaeF/Yiix C92 family enzyme [Roseimicrobium gellanilyticum]|uniref:Permuted papain-like amidase YaeF/Yiix C92 family enzyme n=2 Tax=Roseimicrobium gellanilyticum TaxID=748857 RepID=A0A366H6C9_9BACT|nr:permuted papain-like amidase YaeF/Yiix C92 family enzyme [Roseimicrobium gellanilyticum]
MLGAMRITVFFFALLVATTTFCDAGGKKAAAPKTSYYQPQEGDILFQSLPHMPIVDAIEGCTKSPFSHCGIVHKNAQGIWVVIEAIGPVRETPLPLWTMQGREAKFWVRRLKSAHQKQIPAFVKAAKVYAGRPYDIHYKMDDEAIYCSELIYKAYRDATGKGLGVLMKLGDLDWKPWTAVIKEIEGGNVPLEREMITPKSLAEANELEVVEL